MRSPDQWSPREDVESYDETPRGSTSCDDEFVSILALATEQGSTMDILVELLEDLAAYEQRYEWGPGEFFRRVTGADEEVLNGDFLAWSRTYYRFIALANWVKGP